MVNPLTPPPSTEGLVSYSEARRLAVANKGKSYRFDAGDGWTGIAVWFMGRVSFTSINPQGVML